MAQTSGPISQGTASERQFTDALWRDIFGDEAGVLADIDGSSYALSLPSGSDIVSVGSATQRSQARVAGFGHVIPAGSPEPITIPAAVGSTRTDVIALRYDPTYTGLPGPVRLVRIAGSSASIPAYDAAAPGVEDLPLWAITRAVGQNLSLATVTRMFPRIAPSLELAAGAQLPSSSPLGTTVVQGSTTYRRQLVGGTPSWVAAPAVKIRPITRSYGTGARIYPGVTYTDSGAASISGLTVGQVLHLRVSQNVRIDGPALQTASPGVTASGATVTWSHPMVERFPGTSDSFELQFDREYVLTATGTTVTINLTLLNGLGAPDLILTSSGLLITLMEAF